MKFGMAVTLSKLLVFGIPEFLCCLDTWKHTRNYKNNKNKTQQNLQAHNETSYTPPKTKHIILPLISNEVPQGKVKPTEIINSKHPHKLLQKIFNAVTDPAALYKENWPLKKGPKQ